MVSALRNGEEVRSFLSAFWNSSTGAVDVFGNACVPYKIITTPENKNGRNPWLHVRRSQF